MRWILAAAAVLAVAGCGGEDGITRAEWAQDADAICMEYDRRSDRLGTADELSEFARVLDQAIPLLDEERDALAGLEAPKDDQARVRQLIAHLEKAGAAARRARAAARRGEEDAVMVAVGESDSAAAQAQHIARDLGARACAEP